jgi:hypothetical protein
MNDRSEARWSATGHADASATGGFAGATAEEPPPPQAWSNKATAARINHFMKNSSGLQHLHRKLVQARAGLCQ